MDEIRQLKDGTVLKSDAGDVKVVDFINRGAEGEVYRVVLNGVEHAMKYYFPTTCTEDRKARLKHILANPVKSDFFYWPLHMVEYGDQFGYLMKLLPSEYISVSQWIGGNCSVIFPVLVRVCLCISSAFMVLHSMQYSYKDISYNNIVFNPRNGHVIIIDNDNVTPNGKRAGVRGTSQFMAPELVEGHTSLPTRITDKHSLAVVLFMILAKIHPLKGKRWDETDFETTAPDKVNKMLFGEDACFIFRNPNDLNSHIVPGVSIYDFVRDELWKGKYLTDELRELFTDAFVDGITIPARRPDPVKWVKAFASLYGSIYRCPKCGMVHFYNNEEFKKNAGAPKCENCGGDIFVPRIKINDNIIMIPNKTVLHKMYFNPIAPDHFTPLLGFETDGDRVRIKNFSDYELIYNGKSVGKNEFSDYTPHDDGTRKYRRPEQFMFNKKTYVFQL